MKIGVNMTLSQICFDVHAELKTFIPNIKRSQVYELLSARLGYYTYKHFCQDAILLFDLDEQNHKANNNDLFNKRIQDFDFNINKEQLNKIMAFIDTRLEQTQIYAPTVKDFSHQLLKSINYRQGFDILVKNDLYQELDKACFCEKPNFNAIILHLFLLSRIIPEWDEKQKTEQRKHKVIEQAIKIFGKKAILPYLIAFHLTKNDDIDFIKAFYSQETLREVIEQCVLNQDTKKAHAWYNLALRFGYNNILDGKQSRIYTEETTYQNRGLYSFYDDGEWFNYYEDEGYDPIDLPKLDKTLSQQANQLADEFYQIYQDTQKAIEFTINSFPLKGFQDEPMDYYWYNPYEYDWDFDDEYFSEEYYDDFWEDEE